MQNTADLLTLLQLRDALEGHPDRLEAIKIAVSEYKGRHRESCHAAIADGLVTSWTPIPAPKASKGKPYEIGPNGRYSGTPSKGPK